MPKKPVRRRQTFIPASGRGVHHQGWFGRHKTSGLGWSTKKGKPRANYQILGRPMGKVRR